MPMKSRTARAPLCPPPHPPLYLDEEAETHEAPHSQSTAVAAAAGDAAEPPCREQGERSSGREQAHGL